MSHLHGSLPFEHHSIHYQRVVIIFGFSRLNIDRARTTSESFLRDRDQSER